MYSLVSYGLDLDSCSKMRILTSSKPVEILLIKHSIVKPSRNLTQSWRKLEEKEISFKSRWLKTNNDWIFSVCWRFIQDYLRISMCWEKFENRFTVDFIQKTKSCSLFVEFFIIFRIYCSNSLLFWCKERTTWSIS
jgi:hypothetical protein